jgi:hypothetical protein
MALGYTYGGITKTPAFSPMEYQEATAEDTFQIFDLGLISIPPIAESDIATNAALTLRLYFATTEGMSTIAYDYIYFDVDYIFLLPVDEGVCIIGSVADTDYLAIDGISDYPNVFKTDSDGVITGYPDYVGAPFSLGRESTRIYVLRDDAIGVTFAVDAKYTPQFRII